ncbi:hypothetical protein DTO212C5_4262 [Paecilomyces variotii]|nr:hypothetical protein DTO212C5_4262 [Paecilomyces variotii]
MSSTSKTCSNCAKDLPLSEFVPLRGLKPTAVCLRCREIARRSRLKRIARDAALNKDCVRWRHTTVRRDNRVARRAGDAPRYLRALAPAPAKSLAHLAGDGPHSLSSLAPAPTESLAHRAGDGPHSLSSLAPAPTESPAHRAGDGPRFLRALAPAPTKSPDTTTNKEGDNRSSDITSERTNLTGVEETS